jgi:HK97 family phage prohead protease
MRINKLIDIQNLEVKQENDEMIIEGYASTFGNVDSCNDIMMKGCFGNIDASKVSFLYQHDMKQLVGPIRQLYEDEKGLFFSAKISNTEKGRDYYTLCKDGAIRSLSIGFVVNKGGYEYRDGIRYVKSVKLWEVSLVSIPANDQAVIYSVKGLDATNKRDLEQGLKMLGLSIKEAKTLISGGYSALENLRDAGKNSQDENQDEAINLVKEFNQLLKKEKHNDR